MQILTHPGATSHEDRSSGPELTFFLGDLRGGGAQQVFCNLAEAFAAAGFRVDLLVTRPEGELRESLPDDVRVVSLDPPAVPGVGIAAGIPAMCRYLSRERPTVLYSAMTYANVCAVVAARLARSGTTVVPTEHSLARNRMTSPKDRLVYGLATTLYPTVETVVAVSEGVADSVSAVTGLDRSRLSVVYNPIVTDALATKAETPLESGWRPANASEVVLAVGRLAPEKEYGTLLRAVATLHGERGRDVGLVLLGDGPERGRLQRLATSLGIDERVEMPGYVANPFGYMRRSSVLVSSSRFEGLPTTLVEAMACGCPVVATDCPGGTAEILADGRFGALVSVGDPEGLADAIEQTLRESVDEARLRDRASDFSTGTVVDDHLRLLREHGVGLRRRDEARA